MNDVGKKRSFLVARRGAILIAAAARHTGIIC
jgi:hypothetical protein